ncbi:hypothetical protein EKO27_g8965 [Xylaria grammica]|uniref:Uncharacterized protein n=1 Tax=Xylaria grammica TaxID=363999 RepID=A0A439CVG4_9PEZI|nr:hypothetical protein EKO27_g8965 [Xylaria grammica]
MNNTTRVALSSHGDLSHPTVNLIGLVFSLYNIVSSFFQDRNTPPGTTLVRIQAGLSIGREQGWNSLGGHVPSIVLYNEFGERWGEKLNDNLDTIAEEGYSDILVSHVSKLRGYPHYLSLFQPIEEGKTVKRDGGKYQLDPICISAIWATWPVPVDMGVHGWTGDIGASCGAQWYYSNTVVGQKGFRPPCVWIGRSEKLGAFQHGGFHATPQRQAWIKEHPKVLCDSPARFSMYTYLNQHHAIPTFGPAFTYYDDDERNGIDNREGRLPLSVDWELHRDDDDHKKWLPMGSRDTTLVKHPQMAKSYVPGEVEHPEELRNLFRASHEAFKGTLVTSKNPSHSARTLCESVSSLGPDLVSLEEGLFCDMSQKKLSHLCTYVGEPNCFDRKYNTTHGSAPGSVVRKQGSPYTTFYDW